MMRRLILTLLVATTLSSACRSQTRQPASPTMPSATAAATDPGMCKPEVAERLRSLHELSVAQDAVPSHVRERLHSTVADLAPVGGAEASIGLSRTASSVPAAPIVHHAPRFEGEETPAIVHWDLESVGAPTNGIRYALNRKVTESGADEVHLALWSETSALDVERILTALHKSGVERVNLVGRHAIDAIDELDAPGAARKRFSELQLPTNAMAAARADATMELERIVFDASNHSADFSRRVLDARADFETRSNAYIGWLLTEQANSGCSIPDDHLVWLYRARFVPEAPVALLPTTFADAGVPFEFDARSSYADIAASYEQAFAAGGTERLAIRP